MKPRIKQGAFDRWYIFHPICDDFAWSGSRWVLTIDGVPAGGIQICNFEKQQDAEQYVRDLQSVGIGMQP